MLNTLTRLITRVSFAPTGGSLRAEVCPPVFLDTEPAWKYKLDRWLRRAPMESEVYGRLAQVKHEFCDALAEINTDAAGRLLERIAQARSLLELWHLRADLYHVVAVHDNQEEAERRLARLNRHYPTRSPRSGFVPLDS